MKMEGMQDLQHELRELPVLLLGEDHNQKAFLRRLFGLEKTLDAYQNALIRSVLGSVPISLLSIKSFLKKPRAFLASAIQDSQGIIVCVSSSSAKIRDYIKLVADLKPKSHSPPILLAVFSEKNTNVAVFAREYGSTIADSPFSQISVTANTDLRDQILSWIRVNILWQPKDDLVELLRVAVFERGKGQLASLDMADVDWPISLEALEDSDFALIKTADGILITLGRLGFRAVLLASKRTDPDGLVILGESLVWEVAQAYNNGLEITPQTLADFLEHSAHYRLSINSMQPSRISIHQTWPSIKNADVYQSIHEDLKSRGSLDVIRSLIDVGRKLAARVPQDELNFVSGESFGNALMRGWAPLAVIDGAIKVREGNSKEGRLLLCLAKCPFASATEGFLSRLGEGVPEWFGDITQQYKILKDEEAVGPLCVLHQSYRAHLFDRLIVSDNEVFFRQIACRGGPGMLAFNPSSEAFIEIEIEELMASSHCAFAVFFGGRAPSDLSIQNQISENWMA